MKNLILSFVVVLSSNLALASNPSVECASDAFQWIGDTQLATLLCAGAESSAPVDCAKAAYDEMGDANLAVWLCQRAASTEPVECMKDAYEANGGDYRQAVALCVASH